MAAVGSGPDGAARSANHCPSSSAWLRALDGRTAILDGELVASPDGVVDFYALVPA